MNENVELFDSSPEVCREKLCRLDVGEIEDKSSRANLFEVFSDGASPVVGKENVRAIPNGGANKGLSERACAARDKNCFVFKGKFQGLAF